MSKKVIVKENSGNAVYALGIFGALFYYLSSASVLNDYIIGIVKSLIWPAILVYNLLKFLGA